MSNSNNKTVKHQLSPWQSLRTSLSLAGLPPLVDKHSDTNYLCTLILYLNDLKTSVHLLLRGAHGDKKVLFPFCGIIYDFPSKQWSGRMYFPLDLQHPKRTVILFFTAPSGSIDSTAPRRAYLLLEMLFFWRKCAWEVPQIKVVMIRKWKRRKSTYENHIKVCVY